jgi:hypothetical protein
LKGLRGEGRRIFGEEDMVVFVGFCSKVEAARGCGIRVAARFDSSFDIFLCSEIP